MFDTSKGKALLPQLRDVGTNLKCFIYDLPEATGANIFLSHCQTLIGILAKNKKFGKTMVC